MAREFFKNLPDTSTPLNAQRMNGFLNGEEAMGSIVVDDIKNKNLFNPLNVVNLFPNEDVFGVAAGEYTFYVECEPSTAYSIQRTSENTSGLIVCCSSEKPASGVATINTNNFGNISELENYITPNNAKYLCVRINPESGTATLEEIKKTFQIEKGPTITPYTPYKAYGIVESGSNINGEWLKYDDGTMICCGEFKGTTSMTYSRGSGFYSGTIPVNKNFPQPFIENPRVGLAPGVDASWCMLMDFNYNNEQILSVNMADFISVSNHLYNYTYIAMGRWK